MPEPLTGAERRALEWLRDWEYVRFAGVDPAVRRGLLARGLVQQVVTRVRARTHVTYALTRRGREALDAPPDA